MQQRTLAGECAISGIGLHSGCRSNLKIRPAPADSGIVFCRVDLPGCPEVRALYTNVVDTRNCTCLGDGKDCVISTIEHLMAALSMLDIDNALVEVDNREMPIMDGSALPFVTALEKVGNVAQDQPRHFLKVKRSVEFSDEHGNEIKLIPADDFQVDFSIEFPSKIVGRQHFCEPLTVENFKTFIAPCRTFCEKSQVDYLKSVGLIKGGSLDNAVVLDGEKVLNEGGFRTENECVNHKVIDAIGDMYTSGYRLLARLTASKTGHFHNNEILRKLFADPANYEII